VSDDSYIMQQMKGLDRRIAQTEVKEVPLIDSGTYVPTMLGETTPGATTYTTQVGAWERIGNVIHVTGYVVWTAATGTGNMNISLPFTARSTANLLTPVALYVDGITFAAGSPMGLIVNNTAFIRLYYPTSNAATTIIPVEAAGQVAFHAAYFL
jgi:hypothetical protein